ncbi:transglutaminase-like domain-containing protein [Sulfurimonas sp.]
MKLLAKIMKIRLLYILLSCFILPISLQADKRGVLVWFYTLEVNKNHTFGNIHKFKQTAGRSFKENVIHNIAPISAQSDVNKDNDKNWYLDFSKKKMRMNNKRPLFFGQILDITLADARYVLPSQKHNTDVKLLRFDKKLNRYISDRKDLNIYDKRIQKIKNELLAKNPKIYDFILAVDKFTHGQLKYKKPTRPNTAVDLLSMDNAWCGEFNKLKESLLRAAGIPTRDVYASHYGISGPSYDYSGASKAHVWLQSYIPNIGWVSIPSTRKMLNKKQFMTLREDYYIRAIELYKYPKEIQSKIYSYKKIRRVGGIRGNGMFLEIDASLFNELTLIINDILDYNSLPPSNIFSRIEKMPKQAQALMYWFLISVPNEQMNTKSTKLFIESIKEQPSLDFNKFYVVSSTVVKNRIDSFLNDSE